MDTRSELRGFLTSRRARITPEQAGLRTQSDRRRVPGLRREEVALLAGVSVDYYTRLERGNANGVSDSVLEALARALQLDEAERAHLFDLARAAHTTPARRRPATRQPVRPGVQRILDAIVGALTLTYETMQLTADAGVTMAVYTAEPGSKSEEALKLLASWTATLDQTATADATERA